jgi:cobalt-precorrin-7 (C5)-methyltransferase
MHHIPPGTRVHELADYRHLSDLPAHAVILSTGDPMLAGLGMAGSDVVPGISSLQIAAARLRLPLARFSVVSAHGKDHAGAIAEASGELARGRSVFLLSDPSFDPRLLAGFVDTGGEGYRIAVCERLGYSDERISVGTVRDPPAACSGLFVVVIWKERE